MPASRVFSSARSSRLLSTSGQVGSDAGNLEGQGTETHLACFVGRVDFSRWTDPVASSYGTLVAHPLSKTSGKGAVPCSQWEGPERFCSIPVSDCYRLPLSAFRAVLKTGEMQVSRGFESRPLREIESTRVAISLLLGSAVCRTVSSVGCVSRVHCGRRFGTLSFAKRSLCDDDAPS